MKIRNVWLAALVCVVAGCGADQAVQMAVKNRLKDADSAKFKEVIFSKAGDRACIEWNAKNSFGGYDSWHIAELVKEGETWNVSEMEGRAYRCTEQSFQAIAAGERAARDAQQRGVAKLAALGALKKAPWGGDAASISAPCGPVLFVLADRARDVAEAKVRQLGDVDRKEELLAKTWATIDAGQCPSMGGI